jgi:adenosine deaminase
VSDDLRSKDPALSDLRDFIAGLPKAELHVHHVGSASQRTVAELAARHEGSTPVPHKIELAWCFDIPGEAGLPSADVTLDVALTQQPAGLVSFGLGGPEIGVPRPQFQPYFDRARAAGLRSVPHAGESTGPQTIWDAITHLGAERIGHGIAAAQDPELMAYLREHHIPLEVCPTSNLRTQVVRSYEEHPLPILVASGVPVSINSDDPPMFSTTLNREYELAADLLGLDARGVAGLAKNAVDQSFMPEPAKAALKTKIDAGDGAGAPPRTVISGAAPGGDVHSQSRA